MKRVLTAAVLGISLAAGMAACSKAADTATSTPSPTPTVALKENKEVCESYEKITMDRGMGMLTAFTELSKNTADQAAVATAMKAINDAVDGMAGDYTKLAAETKDGKLKAAIEAHVKELDKIKTLFATAAKDPKQLEELMQSENGPGEETNAAIEKICGV